MKKNVIKFPNSKRKLSLEEEKLVNVSTNLIHNAYINSSPFVRPKEMTEETLKELIHNIFELNEE